MKLFASAVLAALLWPRGAAGFQQSPESAGPEMPATILNSRYCLGTPSANLPMIRRNGRLEPIELYPPDAVTLRLQMSVAIRNAATETWIVPVPNQTVVLAGTDPGALREIPQPFLTQTPAASDRLPDGNEEAPARSLFPTLGPGESLSVGNPLGTMLIRVFTPSIRSEPDLRGKKMYVRLELFSSQWTPRLLGRLAKKWKNYGVLWTEGVRSEQVEIDVPRMPEISDCLK